MYWSLIKSHITHLQTGSSYLLSINYAYTWTIDYELYIHLWTDVMHFELPPLCVQMDRSWMTGSLRTSDGYLAGMRGFIVVAKKEMTKRNAQIIQCPCRACVNNILHPINTVEDHLFVSGFMDGYTCWTKHGEDAVMSEGNNPGGKIQNSEPGHTDIEFNCMGGMETPTERRL